MALPSAWTNFAPKNARANETAQKLLPPAAPDLEIVGV